MASRSPSSSGKFRSKATRNLVGGVECMQTIEAHGLLSTVE
jgi:hypothetical protein